MDPMNRDSGESLVLTFGMVFVIVDFLLLGILSGTQPGYAGSMFYIIVYALMSMGSFGMVILLGRSGHEAERLDDFKGLAPQSVVHLPAELRKFRLHDPEI
ncbi:MAG: hypothetical protein HYY48_08715 [Gammaproteobacteria bacterium]|nr:hypothetical protein [Gammaproteobacteria bacterium]